MFGYVRIRKPELKVKDYEVYHGFYCGLCSVLKSRYGFLGQVTLTYDMTFLILLLTSVYELPVERRMERCIVHPGRKHLRMESEATGYVAHLNILLAYYHLQDDHEDEKSKKAWFGMKVYRRKRERAAGVEETKDELIQSLLAELRVLEKRDEREVLNLADCFGRLMSELFDYRGDILSGYLREVGYYLGRFIYIMDAYDDLAEDEKKGSFNPLLAQRGRSDFDGWVQNMLLGEISSAAVAFQKLPCLEYKDILGNILYAGVWNRYDDIQRQKEKAAREV